MKKELQDSLNNIIFDLENDDEIWIDDDDTENRMRKLKRLWKSDSTIDL